MKKTLLSLFLLTGLYTKAQPTGPQHPPAYCDKIEANPIGTYAIYWGDYGLASNTVETGPDRLGRPTKYIKTVDDAGSSGLVNNHDYQDLGTTQLGCFLNWEQNIIDDGDPFAVLTPHPSVMIRYGSKWIRWVCDGTVTEFDGWVVLSMPIIHTTGPGLPDKPGYYHWDIMPGLTWTDFNDIMDHSTGIEFESDFTSYIGEIIYWDNICVWCPPPLPCDPRFTFDITSYTNPLSGPALSNVGELTLWSPHTTSTYDYDFGIFTSPTNVPAIYTPGIHRICVNEYNTDQICKSCMSICIADQDNDLMAATPAPCTADFKLVQRGYSDPSTGVYQACDIYPDPPNPSSNYTVNWGDGTPIIPPSTHVYTKSGSYRICMTETPLDPMMPPCTKCWNICIVEANGVYNSIKEESANESLTFKLVPNPAANETELSFDMEEAQQVAVKILDITGRVVIELPSALYPAGLNKVNINTETLGSGIYSVQLCTITSTQYLKLSIVK